MSQKSMDDLKAPLITPPDASPHRPPSRARLVRGLLGIRYGVPGAAAATNLTYSTTRPSSFTAVQSSEDRFPHSHLLPYPLEPSKDGIFMRRPQLPSASLPQPQPATDVTDVPSTTPETPPSVSGDRMRPMFSGKFRPTVARRVRQPNSDSGRGTLALLSPDPTKGNGISRPSCWPCRCLRIEYDKRQAQCTQCEHRDIKNPQYQLHPDPSAIFASESRKFLSSRKGERSYPSTVEMEKESGRHRSGHFCPSSNGAETYHYRPETVLPYAPPGRLLEPLEWIPQAKDPTHHSNTCITISLPPEQSLGPLEWIPQAKDPTPTNYSERTSTPGGSTERTSEAIKWISQDKDPTSAPREIVQCASPTTKKPGHRQRRSDADNAQVCTPVAARSPSIISWICRMFRVRPRAVEAQQDRESAVAATATATPTSSVTPCPSLSTVVVPSSEGHKSSSLPLFPPAAKPSEPPKLSLGPVEWVPQARDPTTHSGEVPMDELTDATAKHVAPATRDSHTEPVFNGVDPPYGSIDGDFVQDLTDLVTPGPMIYCGRYSDVYQGVCGQKLVAIKVIKSLPSDSVDAVQRRMRREVKTASCFKHPNVLAVYGKVDWGTFGGIITLWCPNGDARSYLRTVPLPPSARLRMTRGVTAGLEYIHGLSVVHGDLKPGNILIDASGNPLICDFGLVCILDAEQPERAADNTTTIHPGTVRFLSYELAQDPPEPRTGASDIHALGCVTYEFLYRERPYSARKDNNAELYIFRDIARGVPPARRPPMELPTSLASLWSLLESCWDQKPYRRPVISSFSNSLRLLTESDLQHHLL